MLKRFLNPRWQHPDPGVRRQAVASLTLGKDADAIAQVAREDALPALRRMALRQSLDLDVLHELEEADTDPAVRKEAANRYRQVLAGLTEDGPSLAERLDRTARIDHVPLLEFLAREGKDDALREHALARVERESVLRDVALKDPKPELRLAALERIQDEGVLARICEQSRKSDKQVSRRARERLDANKAQRERPQLVAAQCLQICATLEDLGRDGSWNRDEARLAELEGRWHTLESHYRQDHEQRFESARRRFSEALAANRIAEPPIRAAMEGLIARLQATDEAPTDGDENMTVCVAEHESLLREVQAAWQRIERLPDVEEQRELENRFLAAKQAVQTSVAVHRRSSNLASLCARYERLAARKGAIAEGDVKSLEREREALPAQPVTDALSALERRIDKAHRKLRNRLREQATWKEETLAGLPARLDALKTAVADGQASEAVALLDAAAADVEALHTMGTSKERMTTHQSRLRSLTKEVRVMRAWGRFGATRALHGLCEQMEALKDSKEPPAEIAHKVRAARDAWKERSANAPGADRGLWKRFDAAASAAYLPCKVFFEDRAQERKANLERRRHVVQNLETLVDSGIGGPNEDWKKVVRTRGELLTAWHRARPVERNGAKEVAEHFDARMAELDAVLERERKRSVRHREQLITEADALTKNPDKKATAEICKQLQQRWATTVPSSREQENALWERFRSACDVVFAGRQRLIDEERKSAKAGLEARAALCQRVETLLQAGPTDVAEAERELHRVQGEWARTERVPKREEDALESRFNALVRRFAKHQHALSAKAKQADLETMRSKARLCHEAESQLHPVDGTTIADVAEMADSLRSRWQSLPALTDDDEATMRERFEQAFEMQESTDAARGAKADAKRRIANLQARESLCLRLEILAGVDSPPEHAQARMAYQVERLASALKERSDGDNPDDLLRAWCVIGPASPEHADTLEARFQRAWARVE